MNEVRVWAPGRMQVSLSLGEREIPMSTEEGGWWRSEEPVSAGMEYAFRLDGGRPLPDPRSPWQPHGVHGPSCAIDHGAYQWQDSGWQPLPIESAIFYELHVGTFSPEGTFEGVRERLPYLRDLGVTHLELMPIAEFSGNRGWGYDGVDLFAPHHAYGTPEQLKRLVDTAHRHGIAMVLDVVYNHLGPSGNYLREFGPYFTDRYKTPWGDAANFDGPGSDEVRRFVCDNACMWLREYHFDALRLDAIHAICDHSAVHILEQLTGEVELLERTEGRRFSVIGESDLNDPKIVRSREAGGYGLDAQWSDDFHHALHTVLTGERDGYYSDFGRLEDLGKALRRGFVFDGIYSRYRNRLHGRGAEGMEAFRLLGYMQNHDQIGNRAKGDRIHVCSTVGRAKAGAALVLTSPFVPLLFQGEEWAASTPFPYFCSFEDEELAEAVRAGRRREFTGFGWKADEIPDPQATETFEQAKLDWSEHERGVHAECLAWYRRLIELRRTFPELRDGRFEGLDVRYDEGRTTISVTRGRLYIACNLGKEPVPVSLANCSPRLLLASHPSVELRDATLILPPESTGIVLITPVRAAENVDCGIETTGRDTNQVE